MVKGSMRAFASIGAIVLLTAGIMASALATGAFGASSVQYKGKTSQGMSTPSSDANV